MPEDHKGVRLQALSLTVVWLAAKKKVATFFLPGTLLCGRLVNRHLLAFLGRIRAAKARQERHAHVRLLEELELA
jgi:hypothetical protein